MSGKLYSYMRRKVSLADAVQDVAKVFGANATALLYSPRECRLAVLRDGKLVGENGDQIDVSDVFEARIFNDKLELRWLNDPSPKKSHRSVVLAHVDPKLTGWGEPEALPYLETLPQTYLLWGEGTGGQTSAGWSVLATARIGALRVPVADVAKNGRVQLTAVEYLAEKEHGNVVVLDERLTGLRLMAQEKSYG